MPTASKDKTHKKRKISRGAPPRKVKRVIPQKEEQIPLKEDFPQNDHIESSVEVIEDDPEIETIFEEVKEEDLPPQLHDAVFTWIDTIGYQEESFQTTLYKFQGRSTVTKEICFQWIDVVPDVHEIGELFGSGLFQIFINFRGGGIARKTKSYRFRLNKIYDKIKEEKDRGGNKFRIGSNVPQVAISGNGGNSMYETVMVLKEFASIFVPLMAQPQQQIQQTAPEGISKHLAGMYKDVGEVLKSNMMDNIQTYNEIQRDKMSLPETVETAEEAKPTFLEQVMPIIESVIKPLMSMPQAAAVPYANQIRKNPEFKKLQTDKFRKERNLLVQHMVKTYGEKETKKVLKTLKMKV